LAEPQASSARGTLYAPGARRALAGFFVSGMLLSFLGAILLSWGYHLTEAYATIGNYFLSTTIGIAVAAWLAPRLLPRRGIRFVLVAACTTGCGAILLLAAVSPPIPSWWRMFGLFAIGVSASLLHAAIFHAISPIYQHDPGATVNLAGTLFGVGCLATALLFSGTFYVYNVPSVLILLAIIPALFAVSYSYARYQMPPKELQRPIRDVFKDLRSPTAVLFALLLFFQFGNEWALAGWLPMFLTQRLGISPAKSLMLLALYWAALLVGRILMQSVLPKVHHGKLLLASVVAALFGCLILSSTNNRFGALMAILFIGAGFAAIYPLVVEKIGNRFPGYHPGFYNGIFSFALTGGLLAPCTIGYLAAIWSVRVVVIVPLLGTIMVCVLLVTIWAEQRLTQNARTA
jgi:MFS transporter, FHS family, glucose/mannose:H+ symporter